MSTLDVIGNYSFFVWTSLFFRRVLLIRRVKMTEAATRMQISAGLPIAAPATTTTGIKTIRLVTLAQGRLAMASARGGLTV